MFFETILSSKSKIEVIEKDLVAVAVSCNIVYEAISIIIRN